MEDKIVKALIYENKTVLSESAEQPIDIDFTLPEYYPDVSRILKCCAVARISSKGTNGTSVTCEGTVTVTVIYADNDNMLNSYEYQYSFSKNFETQGFDGNICLCARAATDYINCRAVTARKIDVHGAVSITVTATERAAFEAISDIDSPDVEIMRKTVSAYMPMFCGEKSLIIEEETEIGAGAKDVNCIIRYDGTATVKESKLLAGKAVVKGELGINLLYCNDDGEIVTLREDIPLSGIIETDSTGEDCGLDVTAEIAALEIKPKSDADGRPRGFSINAKVLLCVKTFCNNEVTLLLDAYSRKYETAVTKGELNINRIADNINETFAVKGTLPFEEGQIAKVTDLWCNIKSTSSRFEDGAFVADGIIAVSMIVEDADGVPAFYEREIPFNYRYAVSNCCDSLFAEPQITVQSCSYTLTADSNVDVRADIGVNAAVYERERLNPVVDITVDEERPAHRCLECAMVVYFASAGESIWDIASKYLADIDEVKRINETEDDVLKTDKTLLIPVC